MERPTFILLFTFTLFFSSLPTIYSFGSRCVNGQGFPDQIDLTRGTRLVPAPTFTESTLINQVIAIINDTINKAQTPSLGRPYGVILGLFPSHSPTPPVQTEFGLQTIGGTATNSYNVDQDLKDYAYENAHIQALEGSITYSNFPLDCTTNLAPGVHVAGACDYLFYENCRKREIETGAIDFRNVNPNYVLQSIPGAERTGLCVSRVDEFYSFTTDSINTAESLVKGAETWAVQHNEQFLPDESSNSEYPQAAIRGTPTGPLVYGVGVAQGTGSNYYLTIIRVGLAETPACVCDFSYNCGGTTNYFIEKPGFKKKK